jgi:RNA polymerase sigma factor (sigma-70 family)
MTDEQIIEGCIKGEALAQKYLYDKYVNKMMGVCLRYARDHEEAQDVLQDGFIKVFEKLKSYKGAGSLEGWVRRIFVNTSIDNHRKMKAQRQNVDLDSVEYQLPSEGFILESLAARDLLKIVQVLPEGYRTVFNLYAIEGYSHKEIADMLKVSVNTSKSQYSRAKSHLRKLIEKAEITIT